MRRLLELLSVVLLFALCQSQLKKIDRVRRPPKILGCIYGFKKVNETKVCKTREEFFNHSRNETNCTQKGKIRKCFNFFKTRTCFCVDKPVPKKPNYFRNECKKGLIKRCRVDRFTGKQKCSCVRIGPVIQPAKKDYDTPFKDGKKI